MTFPRAFSSAVSSPKCSTDNPILRRFIVPLFVFLAAFTVGAQKKGDLQLRTVHGVVLDKDENPVPSAVVYLKNVKSQAVKTYIADDAGQYRFSGLDPNVDYEIHAEHKDLMSPTRTISSFDSRSEIDMPLKLTKKKPTR
jgi:Carboxypeptidase regulatory-like domain